MTEKVSIILEKSNYPWWKVVKVKVSTNIERSKGPRWNVVRARVCARVEKWMLWRDHYSSVAKCWKQKKIKYENKDKNSKTKRKREQKSENKTVVHELKNGGRWGGHYSLAPTSPTQYHKYLFLQINSSFKWNLHRK